MRGLPSSRELVLPSPSRLPTPGSGGGALSATEQHLAFKHVRDQTHLYIIS